jgi:hypothetical protein
VDDGVECAGGTAQNATGTGSTDDDAGTASPNTLTPNLQVSEPGGASAAITVSSQVTSTAITFSATGSAIAGAPFSGQSPASDSAAISADLTGVTFEVSTPTHVALSVEANVRRTYYRYKLGAGGSGPDDRVG